MRNYNHKCSMSNSNGHDENIRLDIARLKLDAVLIQMISTEM